MDFSWVEAEHAVKADALVLVIEEACEKAERSKRFIDIQLNPGTEWRGWPAELAEKWLESRPDVVADYFTGSAGAADVGRVLRARLHNLYKPAVGTGMGRPSRVPMKGLRVPLAVSEVLDDATWGAMGKMGGRPDLVAIRQAVKIPAPNDDDGDDAQVVIRSAGTVTGRALEARYTSIKGDLYWSDIRNTLQIWVMARPELIEEYREWHALGNPRAFEEGGEWVPVPGGKVEHNPLIHIRTSAYRTAIKAISQWRNDGTISLDAILESGGEEAVSELIKPVPQRKQHDVAKANHQHYPWGLRDRTDCYDFPTTVRALEG